MKKLTSILLLSFAFSLGIVANTTSSSLNLNAGEQARILLENNYYVDDNLSLPENPITKDGKEYETNCYITYPSGAKYKQDKVHFEDAGIYTITYQAKEKSSIKETYEVKVLDRKYHFSSNTITKSTATYGVDSSKYDTKIKGLTVKLYEGETFYYDDLIDLNLCQDDSTCNFFKFFAIPETMGYFDLERVHMRLTDSIDENIYLDIYIFPYPQRKAPEDVPDTAEENWKYFDTFIQVGGQNQIPCGLGWNADGTYTAKHADLSGYAAAHSMYGYSFRKCSVGNEILNLGLNLDTLEFNSTHRIGGRSSVVTDLDDITYNEKPWDGFSNGKVKLSIEGFMYRDASNIPFTFMITQIGNKDLSVCDIIDDQGPEIKINEIEEQAYVDEFFKVPEPTVTDSYSKIKRTKTAVYYNYNSSNEYELDIIDGYFKPDKEGIYTIEYTSTDYFNNETVYKYRVNAIKGTKEDYSISVANSNINISAGTLVDFEALTCSKNEVVISKTLKYENEELLIDSEANSYKFDKVGTYTLTYNVNDNYNNQKTIDVTYVVSGKVKPIFEEDPILPTYYVENGEYPLPELYASDYNDSFKKIKAIASIDLGNGYQVITSDTFKVEAENDSVEEISIRFIASNTYGTVTKTYTVPYVNLKANEEDYDLTNLFKGENITAVATDDDIQISSLKTNKETYFDFVNPLNAQDLSFTFKINPVKTSFDSLDITLTDYEDSNVSLVLHITKNGDSNGLLTINDKSYTTSASFKNSLAFTFNYSNLTKVLRSSDFNIYLSKDSKGNAFSGFPSGMAYLRFTLNNVTGGASIVLSKLNGQALNNSTTDYVKPSILTYGDYKASYKFNETITIYKSIGIDVIDPDVKTTVSIYQDNDISDVNGLLMYDQDASNEYQVKLDYYGTYIVSYTAIDSSKRKNEYMYSFEVLDEQAPTFNVSDSTFDIKVGELFDFSNVEVTDNVDEDISYKLNVIYPDGQIKTIENGINALSFNNEGIYKLRFVCIDSYNNLSVVTYTINVKGGNL